MLPIIIIILVIVGDQLSKVWIVSDFYMYESRELIPDLFSLTYITNSGAAFGFLNGDHGDWRRIFFISVSVIALIAMAFFIRQLKEEGKIFVIAVAMIAGGAAGNLIDRVRTGAVVDFLDFYIKGHHWPAFNVADSAITVGVTLFIIGQLFYAKKE